jgi:hypothetical protein
VGIHLRNAASHGPDKTLKAAFFQMTQRAFSAERGLAI